MSNYFQFGDIKSSDYGIYISGEGLFNAPARDVEAVSVPGKNGDLIIDHGRFENINVTYPAFNKEADYATFRTKVSNLRNALASQTGYQRLTDTFHPDEYRMATFKDGLDVNPFLYNDHASKMDITFNCKPQRFLTSGEEEMTFTQFGLFKWRHDDNESDPYLFRKTAGTVQEVGNAIYDELVGGSVGWNQLYSIPATDKSTVKNDVTITDNRDGSYTLSGTASSTTYYTIIGQFQNYMVNGHKYIILGMNGGNVYFNDSYWGRFDTTKNTVILYSNPDNQRTEAGFKIINGATVNETVKPQIIDLTLLFGSTIADYIYSLEQNTAGAGVNWFKKYFPNDYYSYNAGELLSVNATEHKMVGFNQWDEEWELGGYNVTTGEKTSDSSKIRSKNAMKVLSNAVYGGTVANEQSSDGRYINLLYYDDSSNFISKTFVLDGYTFTTPSNAHYLRFYMNSAYGTTYKNNICINLSCSRNGTYEPYSEHSYTLDDITLRGIPKLDNGKLKYDGDVYKSDGTVTRKYGIVDLGTLTWYYSSSFDCFYSATITGAKAGFSSINSRYPFVGVYTNLTDKTSAYIYNDSLAIKDSSYGTDPTAFKTAMSGVYLVYELATPTTETADPYDNPQVIDEYGTEEYISNTIVPVGHVTDHAYFEDSIIINPTLFPAKPLLEVVGISGTITLGDNTITVAGTSEQDIFIDSDIMECYSIQGGQVVSKNDKVTLTEFPELEGETELSFTGLDEVKVTPRFYKI